MNERHKVKTFLHLPPPSCQKTPHRKVGDVERNTSKFEESHQRMRIGDLLQALLPLNCVAGPRRFDSCYMFAPRARTGVLFAALLAAACAPGAQASSHGANCQDGTADAHVALAFDEAGAGVLQMCFRTGTYRSRWLRAVSRAAVGQPSLAPRA